MNNTDLKIVSNRDINKDRKKLPLVKPDDTPKKVIPTIQHNPVGAARSHNLRMLTEKHNDKN